MTYLAKQYDLVVTSAPGLSDLLAKELSTLSLKVTTAGSAAISLKGSVEDALRICLYSRLAERVLCRLVQCKVAPREAAEALAKAFDWGTHLAKAQAVHVEVSATKKAGVNALAVSRDFISQAPFQLNLSADARDALTLHLYISETTSELAIDLSGETLQRRGYRLAGGKAPLRETLAAAMLLVAEWQGDIALIDPFCGSGTIAIEAALLAKRIAPGLLRRFFGFMQWSECPDELWAKLCAEAKEQQIELPAGVTIKGFDADLSILKLAQANAERAGVASAIHFERRELGALKQRDFPERGLVVTNPPWGERLETEDIAAWLHAGLGLKLSQYAPNWKATVLGARVEVLDRCGMDLEYQEALLNGAEKNWMRRYVPRPRVLKEPLMASALATPIEGDGADFYNRLLKNARQLKSWLKDSGVMAYRLYDRDLPDYNFTIDVYGDKLLVQEWKAPKQISEEKVKARRQTALRVVRETLGCHREQVFLRTRERQKGRAQYQKLNEKKRYFVVSEGDANLLVNLEDYHDSGLFLDHRQMRLRLAKEAKGRRFLNLFSYTASATIHAAVGGAKASVSVDASKRYTEWAANNLALNGYSATQHKLVCTDVRHWVKENHDQFDVVFCDPPTFSNSKSRDDFVVQRDHAELIEQLMKHLTDTGVLFFSCNFRDFVLDESVKTRFAVVDITQQTLDKDMALHASRNAAIHHCFEIRHA